MDEKNLWNGLLAEGEEIRWQGSPKNVGLMDTASKGKTILLWAVALAWLAASFALILPRVIATDDSVIHMIIVMILVDCIPVMMLSMPFSDRSLLNNQTMYAITNRRVLIRSKDRLLTMMIDADTAVEVRKRSANTGNVVLGSAVQKSDSSMRGIAWQGMEQEGKTTGLVLYHIEAAETVKTILEDIKKEQKNLSRPGRKAS